MEKNPSFSGSSASMAFTAGGIGAVVAMLGGSQASAGIQMTFGAGATVSHALNASYTGGGPFKTVHLELDGDTANGPDARFSALKASRFDAYALKTNIEFAVTRSGWDWYLARFATVPGTTALSVHTMWSAGESVFDKSSNSAWASMWELGMGYVGYRVDLGGSYDYGWVQLTPNGTGTSLTIDTWSAAASSGSGGAAGGGAGGGTGTPEPAASGLGLLALGVAGVLRRRRRA